MDILGIGARKLLAFPRLWELFELLRGALFYSSFSKYPWEVLTIVCIQEIVIIPHAPKSSIFLLNL